VSASIGLVPITRDFTSVDELMSAADHACYSAKEKGRNRVQVYQRDDADMVRRHDEMSWVVKIGDMLEHGRFHLYGQPIVSLAGAPASTASLEVLVRVTDTDGRTLLPGEVIRAAERYGLMPRIDRWVVGEALRTLRRQPGEVLDRIDFVSINLSAVSLREASMTDFLRDAIDASGVPPEKICFELTETATIENIETATRLMLDLRRIRCRFALDDFGSGMSSFGYLRELPVDFLKIDGRFVDDIATDTWDRAMVEAIHQMARVMGIQTIAESVSSAEILERVRGIGIPYGQGYWLGSPEPLGELLGAVASGSR
jgi:EAL domain-containing protein (putative c-di-GMP-specific phosphodiesterase class I)